MTERSVVITGAGGFVGSALVRRFIDEGDRVVAVVRPGGNSSRLLGLNCDITECDIRDASTLNEVMTKNSPDVVINSACAPGHPKDELSRQLAWDVNTFGTVQLLESLRYFPSANFIQIGSSLEYAPSTTPLSEDDACEPVTVRGASKLAATIAVRQWCAEYSRSGVILRLFSVYGPRQQPERLIPTLIRCAENGEDFPMLDGTSRRDLVHVDDVANAVVLATSVASPLCPIFNIGSSIEYSVPEVLSHVEKVMSRTINVTHSGRDRQKHDVEHWAANIDHSQKALGWIPSVSLADGIRQMVEAR